MQKLTDFLLRYKKYISAAALLFVLVLVLVFCTRQKGGGMFDTQDGTEQLIMGETGTPDTQTVQGGKLEKNSDPELQELITNYYAAYAAGDIVSLEMLAQPLSDNEKSYISTFSKYYEDYQNIVCYTMPGASEDSYMVSSCYELKFKDVDTLAPGMDFFYVERDGRGKLFINNIYSAYNFSFMDQELDANLYSKVISYEKSADVTALQKEVQTRYDKAVKSDEKLANMVGGTLRNEMTKWRKSIEDEDSQTAETQKPDSTQTETVQKDTQETEEKPKKTEETTESEETKKKETAENVSTMVKTKDICKVRKKPGTDAEVLGTVNVGVKLKKLGTEGEWTKVKFMGHKGYIKSELLKEVKKKK